MHIYNSRDYPRTKDQWWALVDEFWPSLLNIMNRYIPLKNYKKIDDVKGVVPADKPAYITVEELKHSRDPVLIRYFFAAWEAAPDSKHIHKIKNWDLLCDLLSEEDCLRDE